MARATKLLLSLAERPSRVELNAFWILLGFYATLASGALIHYFWVEPIFRSLEIIGAVILIRGLVLAGCWLGKLRFTRWREWAELGCVACLMAVVLFGHVTFYARFAASTHALHRHATHCLDSPDAAEHWGKFYSQKGMFMCRVDTDSRVVWLRTPGGSALFWAGNVYGGLVYSDCGEPPEWGESYYQHIWGPWWRWAQDM